MQLRELREQIENILNNCELPIDAIYFVFKDLFLEVENIYANEIIKEKAAKKKQEEMEEDIKD